MPVIASARAGRKRPGGEARGEYSLPKSEMTDAKTKSAGEGVALSIIVRRLIQSWLVGSFKVKRPRSGHGARKVLAHEILDQLLITNRLLVMIGNLLSERQSSTVAHQACHELFREVEHNQNKLLEALTDHVPSL